MGRLLSTSHDPTTSNDNSSNKPFFLGLLFNLSDLLIPVDSRSSIFGIFDPFSLLPPLRDVTPLGALENYEKN